MTELRIPLGPVVPTWLKTALAAAALGGAGAVGLALGRGPLAPDAAALATPPEPSTSSVVRAASTPAPPVHGLPAGSEPSTPAPPGADFPEADSPEVTTESARPVETSAATPGRRVQQGRHVTSTRGAPAAEPSTVAPVVPLAPPAADEARIESVAGTVRLDDEDGGAAAAPCADTVSRAASPPAD